MNTTWSEDLFEGDWSRVRSVLPGREVMFDDHVTSFIFQLFPLPLMIISIPKCHHDEGYSHGLYQLEII